MHSLNLSKNRRVSTDCRGDVLASKQSQHVRAVFPFFVAMIPSAHKWLGCRLGSVQFLYALCKLSLDFCVQPADQIRLQLTKFQALGHISHLLTNRFQK